MGRVLPSPGGERTDQFFGRILARLSALERRSFERYPLGYVVGASVTTPQTGIVAASDVTGLEVEYEQIAGRRYMAVVHLLASNSNNNAGAEICLCTGTTIIQKSASDFVNKDDPETFSYTHVESPTATAVVTRKVRVYPTVGSGTITINSSATSPSQITILDLGKP